MHAILLDDLRRRASLTLLSFFRFCELEPSSAVLMPRPPSGALSAPFLGLWAAGATSEASLHSGSTCALVLFRKVRLGISFATHAEDILTMNSPTQNPKIKSKKHCKNFNLILNRIFEFRFRVFLFEQTS